MSGEYSDKQGPSSVRVDTGDSLDSLYNRVIEQGRTTIKQSLWLFAGTSIAAVLSILLNIGAISADTIRLGVIDIRIETFWPIRLLLSTITIVGGLTIIVFSLEFQKTIWVIIFLAEKGHGEAVAYMEFANWLQEAHGAEQATISFLYSILLLAGAAVFIALPVGTFIYSLFSL